MFGDIDVYGYADLIQRKQTTLAPTDTSAVDVVLGASDASAYLLSSASALTGTVTQPSLNSDLNLFDDGTDRYAQQMGASLRSLPTGAPLESAVKALLSMSVRAGGTDNGGSSVYEDPDGDIELPDFDDLDFDIGGDLGIEETKGDQDDDDDDDAPTIGDVVDDDDGDNNPKELKYARKSRVALVKEQRKESVQAKKALDAALKPGRDITTLAEAQRGTAPYRRKHEQRPILREPRAH